MSWQNEVMQTLSLVPNSKTYFAYPDTWNQSGVIITYSGLNDTPEEYADDTEYLTEITMKLDIWHKMPERVEWAKKEIVKKLRAIGFERVYALDLFEKETKLHHKTMRFIKMEVNHE